LQIVSDGVVRLPPFSKSTAAWPGGQPSEVLWEGKKLTVVAPPPEIVAAAKMVRAEPQDIEDVFYIMAKRGVSLTQISAALVHFPAQARDQATENLVYLKIAPDGGNPRKPKRRSEPRQR
jgi:hypothetical protein